jgi:hypothetical protein
MSNMSYCRFENTSQDLTDCYENIFDDLTDNAYEKRSREKLIYTAVHLLREIGLNDLYDDSELERIIEALNAGDLDEEF